MTEYLKPRPEARQMNYAVVIVVCIGVLVSSAGYALGDYSIDGIAHAQAGGAIPMFDREEIHSTTLPEISGSASRTGQGGASGNASFSVSTPLARSYTTAHANTGYIALPNPCWFPAMAHASGGFGDVLWFKVPAGYYENAVTATLHGTVTGNLSISSGTSGNISGSFTFGQWVYSSPNLTETGSLNYTCDPTEILLAAGSTLMVEQTFRMNVGASSHCGGDAYADASASVNANALAQITSIGVSDGVSEWGSDSGFFMPEPGTMSLLMLGGIGALLKRRRQA